MSDDNNELSDEEYDALLRDLEGRSASSGGDSGSEGGGEDIGDIDAFLSEIEADAESRSQSKTKTDERDDDLANEFAALEQKGELSAPSKKEKKSKRKKKKKKKKDKSKKEAKKGATATSTEEGAAEQESSSDAHVAFRAAKTALWFAPAVVLWWVLGVYLGQWVSAGWLIALVSAMVVFGAPVLLKKVAKRGRYRPWLLGASVVATLALVAPMPDRAGENMADYGHWPSTMIAELIGAHSDAGIVTTHAAAAGWLGDLIAPSELGQREARQLGTIFPLSMQWPPDEDMIPLLEGEIDTQEPQEEAVEQEEPVQEPVEAAEEADPQSDEPASEVEVDEPPVEPVEEEGTMDEELEALE